MAKGYQKAAQRWRSAMASAGTAYSEGVDAVTQSPTEAAAAQSQAYIDGVARAATSGKWASKLRAVSLQDWKRSAKEKGASRLASGAAAAQSKVEKFWQTWGPIQEAAAEKVRQMPKATFEERKQRALAMMDATHDAAEAMYT